MQRFYITSINRAKRIAKELCEHFDLQLDRDLSLTQSQRVVALMLGYESHAELQKVTRRGDHVPTPFDELLPRADLRSRLEDQASVLVREFDVSPHSAAWIVARLRLTAHPAGPHRLEGPSSIIGSPSLEYRGHAPGRREPLIERDGTFYNVVWAAQDIPAMKRLDENEAASITGNTNTKIFTRPAGIDQRERFNGVSLFATGSSDALTQMIMSLMDSSGADGDKWKARATTMISGILRALVWQRDAKHLALNEGVIRSHLDLSKIIDLADEKLHPDTPPHIRLSVRSYLTSLPGFAQGHEQPQITLEQHGYLQMQFTKILGSLGGLYDNVFFAEDRQVASAGADVGKIVAANLTHLAGAALGSGLQGPWEDVVKREAPRPSPHLVIFDETGYTPATQQLLDFMYRDTAMNKPTELPIHTASKPLLRVRRSAAECVGAADIYGAHTDTGYHVVARMPLPDGRMLASRVEVAGKRRYPVPITSGIVIEPASFDDILAGRYEFAGSGRDEPGRFEDVLRRCGLHANGSDPFALEAWLNLLADGGRVPGLDEVTRLWTAKVEAAGIPALRDRIDGEAIDLMKLSSLDVLSDDHAYTYTRDLPKNAACRKVLASYPMLFGEMWCSPEVMKDISPSRIRKILTEVGMSCKVMDHGQFMRLSAIPAWLADWIENRRFAHSAVARSDTSLGVYGALSVLSLLGESYAPTTEEDWQALVELMSDFGSLFYMEEPWQGLVQADAWAQLFDGADPRWSKYLGSLQTALPAEVDLLTGVSSGFWYPMLEECGLDLDAYDFPMTDQDRDRFLAAFTRLSLRERLAGPGLDHHRTSPRP